jgi:hypothetical protein
VSQHNQRRVVVPTDPTPPFVMIQPQFLLQLLVILFDPSATVPLENLEMFERMGVISPS